RTLESCTLLGAFLVVLAITVLVLAASIVERQQFQESLRHSEEHYRALFESNPHPMWLYDTESLAFLAVNEAALDCYGYRKEEFLAMTLKDLQAPSEAEVHADSASLSSSQLRKTGGWRQRKNDSTIIDVEMASHDFDFYPPRLAEKYRSDDRQVLQEGKRLALEEENPVGGRMRTVRVVKTPVKDEQGRNIGVLGIFWDVSEQRALEAQLRQAQKME